ncbi:aminomethyltransferase family protein [Eubacteriaceae bacterium ES2]|nr:aminomethyltransferase family protein [Eubacteriaceae bacterium ES2]
MYKNVYKDDALKRVEHEAVRKSVGWYLYTHQLLEIDGEDAAGFLDKIFANPIANLKVGSARYTTMLNADGIIIDDVVVFRMDENKFWVSTLFIDKMIHWFDNHKGNSIVAYKDITPTLEMYAVQGPNSKDLLNSLLTENIDEQKFFTIRDNKIDNIPVKISRAGFTGEKLGYEIYVAPENAKLVELKLSENGKNFDAVEVTEFQVMVWTLPTEKGFYLMSDLNGTNPFEVGLERGIDWNRDFIGKEALEKIKREGINRQFVGYILDDDDFIIETMSLGSSGSPVTINDEEIGRVRKLTYGYSIGKNIGYALVNSNAAKIGDKVKINGYDATLTKKVFI